ncbi:flagellin lysine-N-methylase [Schwartzia sp. (in: firmicutes)]
MGTESTYSVFQPDDFDSFVCTGALCPDTCCIGWWDIVLDDAALARYHKVRDEDFRSMLERAVAWEEENGERIAVIRMGAGNRCPFLRNDGWCSIQRKTEEKNLSVTCRTYPRVLYHFRGGEAFRSLCVSCPAAAERVLTRKTPIEFIEAETSAEWEEGLRVGGREEHLKKTALPLREHLMHILRDEKFSVRDRMLRCNTFLWKAPSAGGHHAEHHLEQLIAEDETAAADGSIVCDVSAEEKREALLFVLKARRQNPALRPDFASRLEDAILHAADKESYDADMELYGAFADKKLQLFWENYLLLQVFQDMLPTEEGVSEGEAWTKLVIAFAAVLALVRTDFAANPDEWTVEKAVLPVQLGVRFIKHDSAFMEQVYSAARERGELKTFCAALIG